MVCEAFELAWIQLQMCICELKLTEALIIQDVFSCSGVDEYSLNITAIDTGGDGLADPPRLDWCQAPSSRKRLRLHLFSGRVPLSIPSSRRATGALAV